MVDSVSQVNKTQNNGFVDLKKPQAYTVAQTQLKTAPPADTVVINKKKDKKPLNKIQIASLAIGGISAAAMMVLVGVMLKSSNIFGDKKLLKQIKDSEFPQEIKDKLLDEYKKLKDSLTDTKGSKNYIQEVLKLAPCFRKPEIKPVDITKAKEILDSKIIGLDNVKAQVLDYLKVRNYHIKNGTFDANKLILCLDGPPGTGKTSVAEAIAEALGVPFKNVPLSGVSEANQIIGDRRLWYGSAPGKIVKAMQDAKCSNPVILLDEFDKLGHSTQHGDPANAFIDLLEAKRCKFFTDNYIEFPLDLSNANIIITSNNLQKVPEAIKDRIHVIKIPPYTEKIKKDICTLEMTNMLKAEKLSPEKVAIQDSAITQIVRRGLDDDGKLSQGARKAVNNVKKVFDKILITLSENSDSNLVIDSKFVDKALEQS